MRELIKGTNGTNKVQLWKIKSVTKFFGCQCFRDCTCAEDFKPFESISYSVIVLKYGLEVKKERYKELTQAEKRYAMLAQTEEYVIKTTGSRGQPVYMVDRRKNKNQWWTSHLESAKVFESLEAALNQVSKLKYNDPEVITMKEAKELSRDSFEYDEHPFSSDALGQE